MKHKTYISILIMQFFIYALMRGACSELLEDVIGGVKETAEGVGLGNCWTVAVEHYRLAERARNAVEEGIRGKGASWCEYWFFILKIEAAYLLLGNGKREIDRMRGIGTFYWCR